MTDLSLKRRKLQYACFETQILNPKDFLLAGVIITQIVGYIFCCTFVYYTFIQNVSRNIKAFNSKSIMKSTTTTAFLAEQKNWANSAGEYRYL